MKNQSTFSDIEYQNRKHSTPKEEFLDVDKAYRAILSQRKKRSANPRNRDHAPYVSAAGLV